MPHLVSAMKNSNFKSQNSNFKSQFDFPVFPACFVVLEFLSN